MFKTIKRKVVKYKFNVMAVHTVSKTIQVYSTHTTFKEAKAELQRLDRMTSADYAFYTERELDISYIETKVFDTGIKIY